MVEHTAATNPMALARGYTFSGTDSTEIRFRMRSDARWSDGRPITAHDVVWTYEAMADPDLATPRGDYVEHLDSVTAESDSVVTFYFKRRYPEMVFHSTHAIAPKHVYDGTPLADLASHPSVLSPQDSLVVSGAFKVGAWQRGDRVILVPNPYFMPQPLLRQLVIRVIPDETTRLVELQTGGIDAMRVSPVNAATLQSSPDLRLERIEKRFSEFVAYNPDLEIFRSPNVRRALGMSVDLSSVMNALSLTSYAQEAASVYSPIFAQLRDPSLRPLDYNADSARQLLEREGWVDRDGDGVREKNGTPFRFTLTTNTGNQRRADLAILLQNSWRAIGVDARLQQQEFQTFTSRLMQKDFEAVIYGWQVSLSPDISGTWAPGALQNFVSYENVDLQRQMDSALSSRSEDQAAPYWRSAARILARDQPYTWLYYMDQIVAVRDRLRGPIINTYGAYQNVWEWWTPTPD